jgi:hypothetical protein
MASFPMAAIPTLQLGRRWGRVSERRAAGLPPSLNREPFKCLVKQRATEPCRCEVPYRHGRLKSATSPEYAEAREETMRAISVWFRSSALGKLIKSFGVVGTAAVTTLALIALSVLPATATDLTGTWQGTVPTPHGSLKRSHGKGDLLVNALHGLTRWATPHRLLPRGPFPSPPRRRLEEFQSPVESPAGPCGAGPSRALQARR